jgi:uncharacterized protein YcfL
MRQIVLLTALACALSIPALAGQAQVPAKAKFLPPVKGVATIEVVRMPSKRVGKEMVTVLKIRNTSKAPINLLKLDEYWYDKSGKMVSGDQQAHKKAPIQPGEIVEITLRSPVAAGMERNQIMFRHAYGDAKATAVKEFK